MRAGSSDDAHRLAQRPLDVELDLLAVGLADVQQERLLRGEELPVEEVLELAPVDREELGAHLQAELLGDRRRLHRGDLDHSRFPKAGRDIASG